MNQEHNSENFLFAKPTKIEDSIFSAVDDEEYSIFSKPTEPLFDQTPSVEILEQEVKQLAENEQIEIKAS